jgi:hypothetical protein
MNHHADDRIETAIMSDLTPGMETRYDVARCPCLVGGYGLPISISKLTA